MQNKFNKHKMSHRKQNDSTTSHKLTMRCTITTKRHKMRIRKANNTQNNQRSDYKNSSVQAAGLFFDDSALQQLSVSLSAVQQTANEGTRLATWCRDMC